MKGLSCCSVILAVAALIFQLVAFTYNRWEISSNHTDQVNETTYDGVWYYTVCVENGECEIFIHRSICNDIYKLHVCISHIRRQACLTVALVMSIVLVILSAISQMPLYRGTSLWIVLGCILCNALLFLEVGLGIQYYININENFSEKKLEDLPWSLFSESCSAFLLIVLCIIHVIKQCRTKIHMSAICKEKNTDICMSVISDDVDRGPPYTPLDTKEQEKDS